MKVTLTKQVAGNEQVTIEVVVQRPEDWNGKVVPAFSALDARMYEMNLRALRGSQELGNLSPEAANETRKILALVNGVVLPEPTKAAE